MLVEVQRLKQTWEPVVTAGATAFKTSANQPQRARAGAQQLVPWRQPMRWPRPS